MPQYVFINGERMELLEDRRFAMFPRFLSEEGKIELFDPSTNPARLVPLSTETEDLGVTTRKLVPNRHYFARYEDGTPANVQVNYLIIHNVPTNITARDLGQFFETYPPETYCTVIEADILRWPGGNNGGGSAYSKGRAYIKLEKHRMVQLAKDRTVYFEPMDTYFFVEATDRHPSNLNHQNSHFQPPPLPPPTYSEGGAQQPTQQTPPGPRNMQGPPLRHAAGPPLHQSHNQQLQQHRPSGYYFVDKMSEDHATYSHTNGVFWPSAGNRITYLQAASKGDVFVCMLLLVRGEPFLYGYSKVVWPQPNTEGTRNRGEVAIEWLSFGTMLEKMTLSNRLKVNVCGMSEGTPMKPELGQAIAELIDSSPQNAVLPRGRNSPAPLRTDSGDHHSQHGGGGGVAGQQIHQHNNNPNVVPPRSAHHGGGGHHLQQHHSGGGHQTYGPGNHGTPMHGGGGKKNPAPPGGGTSAHGHNVSGAPLHHNQGGAPPKRNVVPPMTRSAYNGGHGNNSGPNNGGGGGGYPGVGGGGGGPLVVPLPASAQARAAAAAAAAAAKAEGAGPHASAPSVTSSLPVAAPPQAQAEPAPQQHQQPPQQQQKPAAGGAGAKTTNPPRQAQQSQAGAHSTGAALAHKEKPAKTHQEKPKEEYPALPGME